VDEIRELLSFRRRNLPLGLAQGGDGYDGDVFRNPQQTFGLLGVEEPYDNGPQSKGMDGQAELFHGQADIEHKPVALIRCDLPLFIPRTVSNGTEYQEDWRIPEGEESRVRQW